MAVRKQETEQERLRRLAKARVGNNTSGSNWDQFTRRNSTEMGPYPEEADFNLARNSPVGPQLHQTMGPHLNESTFQAKGPGRESIRSRSRHNSTFPQWLDGLKALPGRLQKIRANAPKPEAPNPLAGLQQLLDSQNQTQTPYVDPNLLARVQGLKADTSGLYDAAAEKIKGIYASTSQDITAPISNTMQQYQKGAANMGTSQYMQNDENVRLYDAAGRMLQETSDLNQATDLGTVEKLKGLRGEMMAGLEEAIKAGWNPYQDTNKTSSSSNSKELTDFIKQTLGEGLTETAKEEQIYDNPGFADALARLPQEDLRAAIDSYYATSGGDVTKALGAATTDLQGALSLIPKGGLEQIGSFLSRGLIPGANRGPKESRDEVRAAAAQRSSARKTRDTNKQVIDFLRQWSSAYGPQTTKQTISSSGKKSNTTNVKI